MRIEYNFYREFCRQYDHDPLSSRKKRKLVSQHIGWLNIVSDFASWWPLVVAEMFGNLSQCVFCIAFLFSIIAEVAIVKIISAFKSSVIYRPQFY